MSYQAKACPCCANGDLQSRPVILAPFIARYVFDREPRMLCIKSCTNCGLVFFETRYNDQEIARLYDNYRGERYLTIRHRFEPWYTRKFNDDIGGHAGIGPRQEVYRRTLAAHADVEVIETVLDYAGDRGQMMAGGPGRSHYVFDISGVSPVEGVISLSHGDALIGSEFDVVLLCGIVEHFAEPLIQVENVARFVRPGGLLYIEVPDESFRVDKIPEDQWYERYLEFLLSAPLALSMIDFWSTAVRVKLGLIPPLGFVKQHEHLNFFDLGSLSRLVGTAGLTVLDCFRENGAVIVLCRRPAVASLRLDSVAQDNPTSLGKWI